MQDLKISLVQPNQIWEDKNANFRNYETLIALIEDTHLIILPEMFNTCFTMKANEMAENWDESLSIDWLKGIAKNKSCAITTSLIIKDEERFLNRMVFINKQGAIEYYDKRQLFTLAKEEETFTAGKKETIINYLGWKLNLQVCYDLRFPEIVRNELKGAEYKYDAIIYVANWPQKRAEHWKALTTARAIENQCFVIACNRVGEDGNGFTYSGDSAIINPLGEKLIKSNREEVLEYTIESDKLKSIRASIPFLKDRTI